MKSTFKYLAVSFMFGCYRLSNLFHGMDENTPVRYTVFCSLIKVAATCNAISFIPTDLDQVRLRTMINWNNRLTLPDTYYIFLCFELQTQQKENKSCLSNFSYFQSVYNFFSLQLIYDMYMFVLLLRCASGLLTGIWTQRRSTHSWGWCTKLWSTAKKGNYIHTQMCTILILVCT